MKYDLLNKVDCQKFDYRSDQLKKDKKLVELKVINPIRTDQQNKYLHVLISYYAVEYGETAKHIKQDVFKKLVNNEIFKTKFLNKKTGESRIEWRSSSDLDTGELTIAIDRFRNYASKEAGIYLPEPHEKEFLRHCQVEVDRNKTYL